MSVRPILIGCAGLVVALGCLALFVPNHLAGRASPLDAAESTLTDWRQRVFGPSEPSGRVVIVAIDNATLQRAGSAFPLPRTELAAVVSAAADAGAAALGLDILLVAEGEPASDAALAEALSRVPSVVAAAATFEREGGALAFPQARQVLSPLPTFAAAAQVGLVNVASDVSGTPRHLPLILFADGGAQPHFVTVAAGLATGDAPIIAADAVTVGERSHPLDINLHLPLKLFGPTGTLPTISAAAVLDGKESAALRGRLALIGVTADAAGDTFATPFDAVTPGIEILAGAVDQLVGEARFVRDESVRAIDAGAATALAVGGVVAVALLPLALGVGAAVGLLLAWLALTCAFFAGGVWFAAALPVAAALPPVALTAVLRQLHERALARRAQTAATALARFQSPILAERIARDPGFLARPRTQITAVLFVDLSGFTGISETVGLAGTRELVKSFHAATERCIAAFGGVVMNFMGDGAFAAFGLPDPEPDDADRAFEAALSLLRDVAQIRLEAAPDLRPRARIGLHVGPVVASRLGAERHQQVSITGDVVNLASRLMEIAKENGAFLALSADAVAALSRPPEPAPHDRPTVAVRGRAAPISIALWRDAAVAPAPDAA